MRRCAHTSVSASCLLHKKSTAGHWVAQMTMPVQTEWEKTRIRTWLLTILRFAITRIQSDRLCVLQVASKMDQPRPQEDGTSFSYFVRTSSKICDLIVADSDQTRSAQLSCYSAAITDTRLRRALAAALGIEYPAGNLDGNVSGSRLPQDGSIPYSAKSEARSLRECPDLG
jgi:hypothetical protein